MRDFTGINDGTIHPTVSGLRRSLQAVTYHMGLYTAILNPGSSTVKAAFNFLVTLKALLKLNAFFFSILASSGVSELLAFLLH